jgi:hypothetical protein
MVRRCLAIAAITVSSLTLAGAAAAESVAVIELFTSQGCSSCPPADRLLGELATEPSVIAMSLPIDVWDYLGWHDTLADRSNTKRWHGYSKARGDHERYTPQVVFNGAMHALGSDRAAIGRVIAETRRNKAVMSVPVMASRSGDHLLIALPSGEPAAPSLVSVWALSKAKTVAIARGENKGRTVTYHNVVRHHVHLGAWSAQTNHWSVPVRDLAGDGVEIAAITVQTGTVDKPNYFLGATLATIH